MGEAPVAWEEPNAGPMSIRPASAATEAIIDAEVQKIVQKAYDTCYKTLEDNRALLDALTEKMIEKETIDYDELAQMTEDHINSKALQAA